MLLASLPWASYASRMDSSRRVVRRSLCVVFAAVLLLSGRYSKASWTFEPVGPSQLSQPESILKPCDPARWDERLSGVPPTLNAVCGKLRGDGVERMYAQLTSGTIAELELRENNRATIVPFLRGKDIPVPTYPAHFSAINEKGQTQPSLYVATYAWILKYDWVGREWALDFASTKNSALSTGFAVGDFRGDGQIRAYVSYQTSLAEYSRTPVGWHRQQIPTSAGEGYILSTALLSGERRPVLVLTGPDMKMRVARWRPEATVAVTDFSAHGVSAKEAAAISDLLRVRILNIGNCKSLERQQISTILQEQAFQQTKTIDPESAVRIGRLLNADKVIIGSVGMLDGKRFADTSIVSAKTGVTRRAEYLRWSDDAELQKGVELLAQAACPDTSLMQSSASDSMTASVSGGPDDVLTSVDWARFKVMDVPGGWINIVRLNKQPAILFVKHAPHGVGGLGIIRRISGTWRQESVPVAIRSPMQAVACDGRGDGVSRVYISYGKDPRITEITLSTGPWQLLDFSPNGDSISQNSMDGGALACAVSKTDRRPRLYLERPARNAIFECQWTSGNWRCESIVKTDNSLGWRYLYANPPGWSERDVLIDGSGIFVRGDRGWEKKSGVSNSIAVLPSSSKPRTLYSYGGSNSEISYSADLTQSVSRPLFPRTPYQLIDPKMIKVLHMPSGPPGARNYLATDPNIGQAVASIRGTAEESILGIGADRNVYEYRRGSSGWARSLISGFPGKPTWLVAGDARGDGVSRIYAVETGSLWELAYYGRPSVTSVADPVSSVVPKDGVKLLGDLFRAELGRHGNISVLSREGQSAASREQKLTGGDAGASTLPDYQVKTFIEARNGRYLMRGRLERADGSFTVHEFSSNGVSRDKLPEAAVALALRMAEEWPIRK